jgi:hypothetical protein
MPWFRMHHEARTDAKLRTLADDEFRVWFNLLCYAAEQDNRGRIECADDFLLAIEVAGGDESLMIRVLQKLARLRIICWDGDDDEPGDTLTFINFHDRNYDKPSDHPDRVAERVRRHRAKNETPEGAEETPSIKEVTLLKRDVTPRNDPDKIRIDKTRQEEKRVEENVSALSREKKRATAFPTHFDPPYDWAADELGMTIAVVDGHVRCMRDWALSKGETRKDWQAFARNWLRKAKDDPPRTSSNGVHMSAQQRKHQRILDIANGEPF